MSHVPKFLLVCESSQQLRKYEGDCRRSNVSLVQALCANAAKGSGEDDLHPLPLNELGPDLIREFNKTAETVSKEPWHLFKAASYLNEWCDNNARKITPKPPELEFIFNYIMIPLGSSEYQHIGMIIDGTSGVVDRVPREVVLRKRAATAAMNSRRPPPKKRPAAAVPSAASCEEDGETALTALPPDVE